MTGIADVRIALEQAITALRPDGRYALEDATGIADSWTVSPDSAEEKPQLRDLLARVRIGGCDVESRHLRYPVAVSITLASHRGTRTAPGSSVPLTALDRLDGAARHLMDALPAALTTGSLLVPVSMADPIALDSWIGTTITFLLTTPR